VPRNKVVKKDHGSNEEQAPKMLTTGHWRRIIHQNSDHGNGRFIHFTTFGTVVAALCVRDVHKTVDEACDGEKTLEDVQKDDEGRWPGHPMEEKVRHNNDEHTTCALRY
jgi:hypothetical protein